jgi:hypothetical protein
VRARASRAGFGRALSDDDDDRWRIEVYRDRLKRSLAARFFLRFHIALILGATLVAGSVVDVLLLHAGLRSMLIRYPVAILAAYGTFICGIKLWLDYSGIAEYLDRNAAEKLVGNGVPAEPLQMRRPLDWADGVQFFSGADGEGCLIVIAVVVVVFALGGYAFIAAETIFANVVLEIFLAAGLLRGVRRLQGSGWLLGLWSVTWPSLAFTLFLALMAGWYAHYLPDVTTLADLLAHLRHFWSKS